MLRENLILLRNLRGLSQEQIAEEIGITRQAYSKWEKGETIPDVEKCYKLAEFYNTTIDALLKKADDNYTTLTPPPKGKHIWGTVTVNNRGSIVIPKDAREAFNITEGTRLVVLGEDNEGIALMPVNIFEERIRLAYKYAENKLD